MSKSNIKLSNFSLPTTSDKKITLDDLKNQYTVIYFYPKDDTPGCTQEGKDFSNLYSEFKKINCNILGVSRDTIIKHEKFKAKFNFPFELIADEQEVLCKMFDVMKLKKNFGLEYMGIERSTFLLDKNTNVVKEWRKVKVKNHAEEVFNTLKDF